MAQQTSAIPEPQPAPKRTWQLSPKTIRTRLAHKVAFADPLRVQGTRLGLANRRRLPRMG